MKNHARVRRAATAAAASGLMAALAVPVAAAAAESPPPRQVVTGIRPSWAQPAADRGPASGGTPISVRVYLAGQDPAGLVRYAEQVADPGSPSYRHYLTPAQFARRFGPAGAQLRAVRNWLAGAGLAVTAITDHYVAVRGTAASVRTAFGSPLDSYRTAHGTLRAPRSAVSVPASVAPAVLTITGLAASSARPGPDFAGAEQTQGGVPIGFANPAIYARYGTPAYHDITDHPLGRRFVIAAVFAQRNPVTGVITNLADTFAHDTSLHATRGYDDVTGVGTPASRYLQPYRAR